MRIAILLLVAMEAFAVDYGTPPQACGEGCRARLLIMLERVRLLIVNDRGRCCSTPSSGAICSKSSTTLTTAARC